MGSVAGETRGEGFCLRVPQDETGEQARPGQDTRSGLEEERGYQRESVHPVGFAARGFHRDGGSDRMPDQASNLAVRQEFVDPAGPVIWSARAHAEAGQHKRVAVGGLKG